VSVEKSAAKDSAEGSNNHNRGAKEENNSFTKIRIDVINLPRDECTPAGPDGVKMNGIKAINQPFRPEAAAGPIFLLESLVTH
jgi:hypothetical protein